MNILDSIKGWLGISNRVNAYKARQSLEKDVNEFLAYFMTAKNSNAELGFSELSNWVDTLFMKIDSLDKFIKISNEKINLNNPDVQLKHFETIVKIEDCKKAIINDIINTAFVDLPELPNEQKIAKDASDIKQQIIFKENEKKIIQQDIAEAKNEQEFCKLQSMMEEVDAEINELERNLVSHYQQNEEIYDKTKNLEATKMTAFKEDLLAAANKLISKSSNFLPAIQDELRNIIANAPNLVGSNEDIKCLTKFKDDIIDLIKTDILLKKSSEERTPLSEATAKKEANDIYATVFNEIQIDKLNKNNQVSSEHNIIENFHNMTELKEILEKSIADLGKMIAKKEEDIAEFENKFKNSSNSIGDRIYFSEKIKKLEKLKTADYAEIRSIDAKLDKLEKKLEVHCKENKAVFDGIHKREIDKTIKLKEDLLAAAKLVSEDRGFSLESMPKAPNLVGSKEDIESLIKFKDAIINFISIQGSLAIENVNLEKAKDIYVSAFNKIKTDELNRTNNGKNWETLTTDFVHKGYLFTIEDTPAGQLKLASDRDIFETSYNDQGVASTETTNRLHATNLWVSRLFVTGKDGKRKLLSETTRNGVNSVYALEKGSQLRNTGNDNRAREVISAMLFNNPEKLQRALNGEVVNLRLTSMSLLTPVNISRVPGFESSEEDQLRDHIEAWRRLSESTEQNPVILKIVDENGELKEVKVNVDVAAFNIGVNNLALGWLNFGQDLSDQYNEEAARKLLGDLTRPGIDGWVGEYLSGLNIANRGEREEMIKVRRLATKLKMALRNKEYHQSNGNPYDIPGAIVVLTQAIGLDASYNCKSGKDRTALLNSEIHYRLANEYINAQSSQNTIPKEDKKLRHKALLFGNNRKIQELNTGYPGNKALTEHWIQWFIGGTGMRELIGRSYRYVIEALVGEAGKASKHKKKKPKPEGNSMSREESVAFMASYPEAISSQGSRYSLIDNPVYELSEGSEGEDDTPDYDTVSFVPYSGGLANSSLYESFSDSEDEDGKPGDQKVMSRRGFSNGLGGLTKSPHEGPYYETIPDARPIKGEVVASFVENHYMATPRVH